MLDVGCGTSILSLFAARGGAQKVVGLDGSERIAGFARQVRVKTEDGVGLGGGGGPSAFGVATSDSPFVARGGVTTSTVVGQDGSECIAGFALQVCVGPVLSRTAMHSLPSRPRFRAAWRGVRVAEP